MTGYVTTIFHQHFEKTIQEGVVSKFEDITISPDGNYALLLHQDGIIKMMISSGVVNDIQRLRLSNDQHSSFNGIDISPDASYALVTDDVNHRIKKIFLINGEVVSVVTLPTANRGQDFLPNKIAISPLWQLCTHHRDRSPLDFLDESFQWSYNNNCRAIGSWIL